MKELKKQLHFAWKNVTLDTLKELAYSMPTRLKMTLKIKAGILVTDNLNDQMKDKPKIYLMFREVVSINNEMVEENKCEETFFLNLVSFFVFKGLLAYKAGCSSCKKSNKGHC